MYLWGFGLDVTGQIFHTYFKKVSTPPSFVFGHRDHRPRHRPLCNREIPVFRPLFSVLFVGAENITHNTDIP